MQPNMTEASAPLNKYFVFLTNRVGRLLGMRIRQKMHQLEHIELNATQIGLLADLWIEDGQRQQDLAIATIKDKGTVARAIQALEKQGMIRREGDPDDRRNKRIFLTPPGAAFHQRLKPLAAVTEQEATNGIAPEDLATCREVLERIYHNLHANYGPVPPSKNQVKL